ncbi:hypothetical protein BDW22DRAFT_1196354 [Trametopsis cervina]|nr:hypothetical protein BDW22DRAFT_1196354 [Trametopsis cervina]
MHRLIERTCCLCISQDPRQLRLACSAEYYYSPTARSWQRVSQPRAVPEKLTFVRRAVPFLRSLLQQSHPPSDVYGTLEHHTRSKRAGRTLESHPVTFLSRRTGPVPHLLTKHGTFCTAPRRPFSLIVWHRPVKPAATAATLKNVRHGSRVQLRPYGPLWPTIPLENPGDSRWMSTLGSWPLHRGRSIFYRRR